MTEEPKGCDVHISPEENAAFRLGYNAAAAESAAELTTLRARLAEAEKAQHYWHQKWEVEREKSRRLVECVNSLSTAIYKDGYINVYFARTFLATVSDLTAAAEDEVK